MNLINFLLRLFLTIAMLIATDSWATDPYSVTEKSKVEKILQSIPVKINGMSYKNLDERLPQLGISVKTITVGKLQKDEIESSEGLYKTGDILYSFYTNEPNDAVKIICPIWNSFSFIKRGNNWLPWDRTSNFLIKGYECTPPRLSNSIARDCSILLRLIRYRVYGDKRHTKQINLEYETIPLESR